MIHWLRERLAKDEAGFTLIELMVVVLIIAILIAIAIPTFLGARERAQDRATQSDLRNGLAAEKVYYVDFEAYTATAAALTAIEPSLAFDGTDVAVAIDAGNDQV
ncbi:MAG: prepilin-type N-terminal cleavage/methylation domain-containing protein, partial [Acidimicrobiia bacterium]